MVLLYVAFASQGIILDALRETEVGKLLSRKDATLRQ
jgi:hypothetical protein